MSFELRPTWAPPEIDLSRPSAARVYDYLLGGSHNFAADRDFADRVRRLVPRIAEYAQANRAFLGRVVRHAASGGYRQFLDIGSGIPTVGNVHEIADTTRAQHDARVVYVDNEPVACAHTDLLLRGLPEPRRHIGLRGDLLHYEDLWDRVLGQGLLDPGQPVVLLVVAVLHFVKDRDDPDSALAFYRRHLPAGSLLAMSTMTNEAPQDEEEAAALRNLVTLYEQTTNPGQLRGREEFTRFFGDLPMLDEGVVYAPRWRPDPDLPDTFATPEQSRILAGVARVPD
jgi:hypothetical protein